jgi:hypothetical protein
MTVYHDKQTRQGLESGQSIVRVRHTDLTAAALTQVLTFAVLRATYVRGELLPANAEILTVAVVRHSDFSGTGVTAVTVDVGDAAAPTELAAGVDVFTGAKATAAVSAFPLATPQFEAAAYGSQVTITSVGANVDQIDAGDVELRISYRAHVTDAQV